VSNYEEKWRKVSGCGLQVSGCRLQVAEWNLQIEELHLQNAAEKVGFTNLRTL
jgi:hypothetical protein